MTILKQVKRLSKDTLLYGLGSAVQGLIVFLLFPIYTRILAQEDFGAQDLVLTAVTVVTFFLILGLDSGAARYYYDTDDPAEKKTVLSTWLWFEVLVSIPACLLVIWLAEPICRLLFNDAGLAPVFRLGVATIPFAIVARVFTLSLRLTFQAVRFSAVIVSGALIQALTAIGLVVIFHMGVEGVFLAMMASNVVQVILGIVLTHQNFLLVVSRHFLRQMLVFGVPLIPASLSLWILNYSNRYFLSHYGGMLEVAVMAAGGRIATILTFCITAFQNAWPPFAYSLLRDEDLAKRTYARVLTYFLLVSTLIGVGLAVFAREAVIILATNKYEASTAVVPWLVFSAIAWGVVGIVGIGFEIAKKSYHFSIAAVLGSVITTLLNIWLIPMLGVTGAAIATLSGNVIALAYAFWAGQRSFSVAYENRKIIVLVMLAVLSTLAGMLVNHLFPVWRPVLLALKAGIYALFLLAIVFMRVISWNEIQQAFIQVKGRFTPSVSQ